MDVSQSSVSIPSQGFAYKKAAEEAIRKATEHLSERDSVFGRDEFLKEIFAFGKPGSFDYKEILKAIESDDELAYMGGNKYTSKQTIETEAEILVRARVGCERELALTDEQGAEEFIDQREDLQGYQYSAGQRRAVQLALTAEDSYIGIVGAAGAGKSTALAGVTAAFRGNGYEVIGLAPSSAAAGELKDIGANDSRMLASFLLRAERESKKRPRLILVDEAGMISSRDMRRLMRSADRPGDRVILIGDPDQLQSVEAGSPFD